MQKIGKSKRRSEKEPNSRAPVAALTAIEINNVLAAEGLSGTWNKQDQIGSMGPEELPSRE